MLAMLRLAIGVFMLVKFSLDHQKLDEHRCLGYRLILVDGMNSVGASGPEKAVIIKGYFSDLLGEAQYGGSYAVSIVGLSAIAAA